MNQAHRVLPVELMSAAARADVVLGICGGLTFANAPGEERKHASGLGALLSAGIGVFRTAGAAGAPSAALYPCGAARAAGAATSSNAAENAALCSIRRV